MKMKPTSIIYRAGLLGILLSTCSVVFGYPNQDSPPSILRSGSEYLDDEGDYELTWNIYTNDMIIFEVRAKTLGWIGLGLSPNGDMVNSDIFIGGVYDNGGNYSSDRHATGYSTPVEDQVQNYELMLALETKFDNETVITFQRLLNTCDDEDYPITETMKQIFKNYEQPDIIVHILPFVLLDSIIRLRKSLFSRSKSYILQYSSDDETIHVIWAIGETDDLEKHAKRGTKSLNFYRSDDSNFKPENFDKIDLLTSTTMPDQHTSYMCTFHKAPPLNQTHHIIGFEAIQENPLARQHTHHFVIYKCKAPVGVDPDELFGGFVGQDGRHCYDVVEDPKEFPTQYCMTNYVYIWSKGGKRLLFADDIGFPIPEPDSINKSEYYVMEVHYDNPDEQADLKFETGARIYHTDKLREKEAGLLIIDHSTGPALTVPPLTKGFILPGHCSSECTNKFVPNDGIMIFNNLFHSHLQGRQMKLRHFRGNEELPWVDVDNHYDFNFQQNKNLKTPVQIMKGDQLVVECNYENSNSNAIIGGLSTKEEMCEAIVYYYPKQNFSLCGSRQNMDEHFQLFGITNFTEKDSSLAGGMPMYDIIEPAELAGDYLDSISNKFSWTDEFYDAYQLAKMGEQEAWCYGSMEDVLVGVVSYPENFEPYEPENNCTKKH